MSKANVKRDDKGAGSDFINTQRAIDEAINARKDSDREENKKTSTPGTSDEEYKSDVSVKKSGQSKH